MHDQGIEPESVGAIQFLAQCVERLEAQGWRRCRNIYEIAVVSHNRPNAGFGHASSKEHHLIVGQRAGPPLASRLGENLQRLAFRSHRAIHCARESPCDREMSTEPGCPPRVICAVGWEPGHYSPKTSAENRYTVAPWRQASARRPAFTHV